MSERKKGGGLDYTPRAFPGARAPDGPAADLEEKLANLGLVDDGNAEAKKSDTRRDESSGRRPGAKRPDPLDYTPRAFSGARAPDGPAPDLEARLMRMGLAEGRTPQKDPRPSRRNRSEAPDFPLRTKQPRASSSAGPTQLRDKRSPRVETAIRPSDTRSPQSSSGASPPLRPVPPEAAPRPLPVTATDAPPSAPPAELVRVASVGVKSAVRAARSGNRPRRSRPPGDRVRMSLRLEPSVDQQLEDLTRLRGLDRNTAVGVAIAQDWIACFGGGQGSRRG